MKVFYFKIKKNVTIVSESNDPTKCILEWDGYVGYEDKTYNDSIQSNKCIVHVNGGENNMIQGFTFRAKNTRYCFHSELNVSSSFTMKNCILDWNNRPNVSDNKTGPCLGMGGSYGENFTIERCVFKNDGYNGSNLAIQWHDNPYGYPDQLPNIPYDAEIVCKNCLFNDHDINLRSTELDRVVPFVLTVDRCSGINKIIKEKRGSVTENYWTVVNNGSFVGSVEDI